MLSEETLIPLNLVYTYPVSWDHFKVLRDLIQNFYDAVGRDKWSTHFDYYYTLDNELFMIGKDVSFSYEWLLHIGASTKRGGDKQYAGYFGEGFKIASLCAHRDHHWDITIASKDWEIEVTTMPLMVDGEKLTTLAYLLRPRPYHKDTILKIEPFYSSFREIFEAAHLSFYYSENPLFGECLWESEREAIYLRSKMEKPYYYPSTNNYPGTGIIFAGFQALGSHQYPLVLCLHDHKFKDRERNSFYKMDVVSMVSKIAYRLPPEPAFELLELLRSRWYDRPKKRYDFESWHGIVATLVDRIALSPEMAEAWRKKYPRLLLAKRIPQRDIIGRNKRSQALDWFRMQRGYKLVNNSFEGLGYPSLEDACEEAGGFSRTRQPEEHELVYIRLLEEAVKTLFGDFFLAQPPCEIINTDGVWRGLASCIKLSKPEYSKAGIKVRFRLKYVALKDNVLQKGRFGDALSTYLHELAHCFGGDRSASFSSAMTELLERALKFSQVIEMYRKQWNELPNTTPDEAEEKAQ